MKIDIEMLQNESYETQSKILYENIMRKLVARAELGEYHQCFIMENDKLHTDNENCPYVTMTTDRATYLTTTFEKMGFEVEIYRGMQWILHISFNNADYNTDAGVLREYVDLINLDKPNTEQLIRFIEIGMARTAFLGKTSVTLVPANHPKELLDTVVRTFKDKGFDIKNENENIIVCW